MINKDAFAILGIHGQVTGKDIKNAYRIAAAKYHPDRNAAGLEMMQLINAAYNAIRDFEGYAANEEKNEKDYGSCLNNALNAIISFDLKIEICGAWIWISGNTKNYKDNLKAAGYKWAPKKLAWYFRPAEYKSRGRSASWAMDKIRESYGSTAVVRSERKKLVFG